MKPRHRKESHQFYTHPINISTSVNINTILKATLTLQCHWNLLNDVALKSGRLNFEVYYTSGFRCNSLILCKVLMRKPRRNKKSLNLPR